MRFARQSDRQCFHGVAFSLTGAVLFRVVMGASGPASAGVIEHSSFMRQLTFDRRRLWADGELRAARRRAAHAGGADASVRRGSRRNVGPRQRPACCPTSSCTASWPATTRPRAPRWHARRRACAATRCRTCASGCHTAARLRAARKPNNDSYRHVTGFCGTQCRATPGAAGHDVAAEDVFMAAVDDTLADDRFVPVIGEGRRRSVPETVSMRV